MTVQEFLYGDPYLVKVYRDKHRNEIDEKNYEMWLQGMYIYEGTLTAVSKCLSGKSKLVYPSEPYQIRPKTSDELKVDAEKERQKFISSMNALKDAYDRK